jgi:hypothetical protein
MFEVESFANAVMNAARKSKFTTADTRRELLALAKRLEGSMEVPTGVLPICGRCGGFEWDGICDHRPIKVEKQLVNPADSAILQPSK